MWPTPHLMRPSTSKSAPVLAILPTLRKSLLAFE
jgi:hypothetical protein